MPDGWTRLLLLVTIVFYALILAAAVVGVADDPTPVELTDETRDQLRELGYAD